MARQGDGNRDRTGRAEDDRRPAPPVVRRVARIAVPVTALVGVGAAAVLAVKRRS